MVADEFLVKVLDEAVWAVVDSHAHDGHVVRVHDAVAKADTLPHSHHLGGAFGDFFEEGGIFVLLGDVGEEVVYGVVEHLGEHLLFVVAFGAGSFSSGVDIFWQKDLERSKPQKIRSHSQHNTAFFLNNIPSIQEISVYFGFVTDDETGCSGSWDSEIVHRFRAEELANRRPQDSPPI